MRLHAILRENALAFPGRPWLHCEGAQWSYAQGDAIVDKTAAGLMRAGVRPGDRVVLLFTNCAEIVFCYFACFGSGR